MQVREIMTENPVCCTPDTNLQEVARLMLENDCGLIPVVNNQENKKPVGTITDRDIAIRTVAAGQNPVDIQASEIMTKSVATVTPETSVEKCCDEMEDRKIRRILVVDKNGRCCGIVAQADVAEFGPSDLVSDMVEEISESAPSPNQRRTTQNRKNRSFSTQRSSFRTSNASRMEMPQRFQTERHTTHLERHKSSKSKSIFSFNSLLPLLAGISAGAALKYFVIPENKSENRITVKHKVADSTFDRTNELKTTPLAFEDNRTVEKKEVITGSVTSPTQTDKTTTTSPFAKNDDLTTDKKIGHTAS